MNMVMTGRNTIPRPGGLAWLTLERAAYGLALLLALALRLAGLAYHPLAPAEAQQAWAALSLLKGQALASAPGVSPLLLALQLMTFGLSQATELAARLWPALAGALLVLTPYGLRRELGRTGALLASLLLALSGSLSFFSRAATGDSFALLAMMALLICLAGWRREGPAQWAVRGTVALALLLLSAPAGYAGLLLLMPVAFSLGLLGPRGQAARSAEAPEGDWRSPALLAFVVVLVLGATALFLNPQGLGVLADLPAAWLGQFTEGSTFSWWWLAYQLVLGQPLLLVAGLAGLALALRSPWQLPGQDSQRLARGLGLWLLLGLLLTLRPGRQAVDVALLALPLALLGGPALALAGQRLDLRGQALEAMVLALAGIATLGASAVWLATYAGRTTQVPAYLIYGLAALLILLALLVLYALLFGRRTTVQVGVALLLLVLFAISLRFTMTANHNRDGLRWGSAWPVVGATDGPDLPAFLEQLATERGGDLRDLDVTLLVSPGVVPSPLLNWYLRRAVVREAAGPDQAGSQVLVSLADQAVLLDDTYSGRSFRLSQSWSPEGLSGPALWRWLFLGRYGLPRGETRAVVWVGGGN